MALTRVWEWRWQDLDTEKMYFKQDVVKDVITGMRREDVKPGLSLGASNEGLPVTWEQLHG